MLGPHPDDFDAIAVTLHRLAENGNPLHAAVVRTGSGVLDSYAPDLTWERKAAIREREQRESLRFFGLPDACLTFLSLDSDDGEGQLCETPRNREALAAALAAHAPDLIFLPHGNDTNSAHRALYAMVRALVSAPRQPVTLLLIRDPKTVAMRTDLYTPFGPEQAAWKAALLRFHDTQHQRNRLTRGHGFDDRILEGNRQIARDLSLDAPYAEAFEVETYRPEGGVACM
jgi:LmbE family N-acetylglucosaminyl deacetylase